jgi:hypothetical protein
MRRATKAKALISATAFLLVFLAIMPMVHADEVTLTPTADSFVDSTTYDANFGWDDVMMCSSGGVSPALPYSQRTYLKFDVTGIVGTISKAVLRLYCDYAGPIGEDTLDVDVCKVTDDTWAEDTITWNNQPVVGGLIITTPVGGAGSSNSWDITSYVKEEHETGNKIVSVVVKLPNDDPPWIVFQHFRRFLSRESMTNKPVLEITYSTPTGVPEFGANVAIITSIAAAAVFALRRPRK